MNWVGGSRKRLVKDDAKKQKEFFEKRKMQQKLKNMGIPVVQPATPGHSGSTVNMDLVTLFIVNQIAAKKEKKDPPKVAVFGGGKSGFSRQNKPLVLPMSPCSPSQLSLVESQPQCSARGTTKRTQVIPPGFKCRQLSPVLESAFSDVSASDYLAGPLSPFSPTSSVSSGQGIFPLNLRSQTQTQPPPPRSSPLWDTSGQENIRFQPFSQPRSMTDNMPWFCGSNPPLYQQETPRAAQVLFANPEPDESEHCDVRREVSFCLNQPDDRESVLDFTLNQSESEQQFEEDVFRGFSNEEFEREDSHFRSAKSKISKIYLKDTAPVKASAPQTVPDSQTMGMELSNYSDINFTCPGHNTDHMNGCGCCPNCSCGGGYLSSDSSNDDDYSHPCHQASSSSYVEQGCADPTNQVSQHRQSQPRPPTPLIKPKSSFRVAGAVMENVACPGSTSQQIGSGTTQFAFPHPEAETRSPELCKCKKTSCETRDAGTQTAAETRDASTQCRFVADGAPTAPGFNLYLPPVDTSVQQPATGRQASSGNTGSGGKQTPWSKKKVGFTSGCHVINKFTANSRDGTALPFLTDGGDKENDEGRANRPSEEAETLHEIADILLLLKQRKKEG